MEPTKGQVIILSNTQDLVRDVTATEPLGNRDHAAICFALHVRGTVSNKSDIRQKTGGQLDENVHTLRGCSEGGQLHARDN